jgi:S1-C subfamily serine protease
MTTIDWVIVAFAALLALRGYSRGFLVGALTLAGFAAGALIGTRLGPLVLSRGNRSPYAPLFDLAGALLAGGILASALEGVGRRIRAILPIPLLRTLDGLMGALLTGALAIAIAWLLGAIVLQAAPGSRALRADIQRSVILRELNSVLPPSGAILNALARIDPLPSVSGPAAHVPAPARGIVASRGVGTAFAGVVRVVGTACGLGIEGSGWVASRDLVVTNAHVVAGESDTVVEVGGAPPGLSAVPVVFDAYNDIAVLRVQGLDVAPLALAPDPQLGTGAAILGYPLDGPFDAEPARLGQTQSTETENAYGDGPVLRMISALRGLVRPGNSGGPLVDGGGSVVGTVFAAVTNPPPGDPGGFAVPNSVVAREIARARSSSVAVSSGTCTG